MTSQIASMSNITNKITTYIKNTADGSVGTIYAGLDTSAIEISKSLVIFCSKEELYAILAREIYHIESNDVGLRLESDGWFIGSVLASFTSALTLQLPVLLLGWGLLNAVGYHISQYYFSKWSREEEYKADAFAAKIVGNNGLLSYLRKLQFGETSCCTFENQNSYHPHSPIAERIKRLQTMNSVGLLNKNDLLSLKRY